MQILSPAPSLKRDTSGSLVLEVDEGGEAAQFTIRPTVPILCPVGLEECVLGLEVNIPQQDDGTPATCNGQVRTIALQTLVMAFLLAYSALPQLSSLAMCV